MGIENMPASYKLYDGAWPSNALSALNATKAKDACQSKCESFPDCGYTVEFPGNAWCTVLSTEPTCDSLDKGEGDCGSSGVGAHTYKYNMQPATRDKNNDM